MLVSPEEMDAAVSVGTTVFGRGPRPSQVIRREIDLITERDRMFVVHDGPAVAGIAGAYSFDVALPGGGQLAMSSVTDVGVAPTHRRRGILRALMAAVVDQAVERDEPIAGLTASEAVIYRRFGFGVATRFQNLEIDPRRTGHVLAELAEPATPRLRLIDEAEAVTVLPDVWAKHWRRFPGELSRKATYWEALALDPEEDRDGATARFIVVHEGRDGEPDGFATYRLHLEWAPEKDNTLYVGDVAAVDDAVEAALLRYLLDVDLLTKVVWFGGPLDHPLRWQLADSRAVRVTREQDHLWLRPLDVPRCLAARRYAAAGGVVIEVVDTDRPEVGGRFRLDAGPGGADCVRTSAEADLALGVAELGSLLLGGVTWATLWRAGLVGENTPGAVARADTLFRPERTPYCGTEF